MTKKIALKESNLKESQLLQSLDKGLNTSKIIISPLMDKNIGFCFTVKKLSVHPEPVLSRLEGLSRRMKLGILHYKCPSTVRPFDTLRAHCSGRSVYSALMFPYLLDIMALPTEEFSSLWDYLQAIKLGEANDR